MREGAGSSPKNLIKEMINSKLKFEKNNAFLNVKDYMMYVLITDSVSLN